MDTTPNIPEQPDVLPHDFWMLNNVKHALVCRQMSPMCFSLISPRATRMVVHLGVGSASIRLIFYGMEIH